MSSNNSPDLLREPCEGDSCLLDALPTFFCAQCDCSFCDTCWDKQPAHKPKKRATDGHAHEKIDRLVVERYRNILEPSSNLQEQESLHKDDEDTTWFGIGRDQANDPVFEDYGQYATLMAKSLSEAHKLRYPQLVSFVGQTGAGKSTVVKMLINHQDMKTNPTAQVRFPSPVVGSVNDNVPVSADVHLYADPDTILTESPVLYADCEGLEGGESAPRAEALQLQDKVSEMNSQRKNSQRKGSLEPNARKRLRRKGYGAPRNLIWATGDKEKSKREYAVTELYPRVLYTFSDVVVFVLRNSKTFESAVLTKLIGWASSSFEKSLGQPALPHVIIALNATDLAIDPSQWDVKEATQKLLADVEDSVEKIPALQPDVEKWRLNGRSIKTTKDLLECYYSSVTVVRIPAKGRYMLIDEQVEKLHKEIVIRCHRSHSMKRRVRMLSNSDDLQLYLQLAFDHFSQNLEAPFNFVEVALKINPIPSDFSGNILKLAVAFRDRYPPAKVVQIFDHLSLMVASCVMLDIHRHRRLGTPNQLLEDHYMAYCEQAFSDFCDRHWPCNYYKKKDRCVNVLFGHTSKGHQNREGKVLASGDFVPSFHYNNDLCKWIQRLEREINDIQESRDKALLARPGISAEEITSTLHLGNINTFYNRIGSPSGFMSHSTCFCCLREIPVHPLSCGHVLCTPCVRSYGVPKGKGSIEVSECPMGRAGEQWSEPCLVKFKPPLAGVRVLCLDGGGIRGIVELEVLKAIERELPVNVPIRSFFDLIVGTSTGGIIALGLGVEGWSVDACIDHFKKLCSTAFIPRELHGIPVLQQLAVMNHSYSRYKTRPLEGVLQASFSVSDEPLFGGRHSQSSVKVAVTSTTETGSQAVLMTNYNRHHQKDNHSADYSFERAEKPETELKVWEAARATSAAPSYFKAFKSKHNSRGYLDGALYHNNPVRVADLERRLIWPDTENSPPDILLSIGTSCNNTIFKEAQEALRSQRQGFDHTSDKSKGSWHGLHRLKPKRTQTSKLIKIVKNHVESVLDTETTWLNFMSDAARGNEENKSRYCRINPNIGMDPPKLDEAKMLPQLQQRMHQMTKDGAYQKQIGIVARQLVASCFHIETSSLPANLQELDTTVTAQIKCRFPSDSQEIRHLGEYLKNVTTMQFQPYFIIRESNSTLQSRKEIVTRDLIQGMTMNASFGIGPVVIAISNESAITAICLSIVAGEELPISGFPRALMPKKITKALPLTPSESQRQAKVKHPARRLSLEDDSISQSSEASSIAFSELKKLQKLPDEARLPILRFVQERTSGLHTKDENVPKTLRLLAEAAQEADDEKDGTEIDNRTGPYGSILHTAAAVGLDWIIELQIKAGVDLASLDHHGWTALMVATAQGHQTCAQLLSEHMFTIGANSSLDALPPAGLVKTESSNLVRLGSDNLSIAPRSWLPDLWRRIQVRSDHPIPPRFASFYYEMSILNNGPLGIIGLGLCRPETNAFGMPGWHATSFGYYGDDGRKFNLRRGLRYSKTYTTNDTVGCGINRKTGKVFFTLNGNNQGVAFVNVTGMLFPVIGLGERESEVRVNFGRRPFVYNIDAHDWTVEESAATIQARKAPLEAAAAFTKG